MGRAPCGPGRGPTLTVLPFPAGCRSPRGGLSHEPAWAELLCPDITGFTIRPVGALGLVPIDPSQGGAKASMPAVVTVLLEGTNGAVMNETLVLR